MTEITEDEFKTAIKTDGLALVEFYSKTCVPCRQMAPIIKKLEDEYDDVVFLKVNAPENPKLSNTYNVQSLPMFFLFCNGKLKTVEQGAISASVLEDDFERYMDLDD